MFRFPQFRPAFGPLSRRELLRVGALAPLGLGLPTLLRAQDPASRASRHQPKARSCILFFLEGGPSHIDLWDMKPHAPAEIRGIFKPIATSLPGVHICEHLPSWAPLMHHLTLIRSVTHKVVDHNAGSYYALTGWPPFRGEQLIVGPSRDNTPPLGAVVAKLRPSGSPLPDFVHLPDIMSNNGYFIPGQDAGFLGDSYDPFVAGDPSLPNYKTPGLEETPHVSARRLVQRRSLLAALDRPIGPHASAQRLDTFYEKAFNIVTSAKVREAFDVSREPERVRRRYGLGFETSKEPRQGGGLPSLGQSLLLARRLIEAGVRLVTVTTGRRYDQTWDTHRQHYPLLTRSICPYADRAFSALLEDLVQRGLLEETLVVAMGEFGRTPKLGQITSPAGATPDGRDHWPHCYTVFLAGGGIKPGIVYGASDRDGAYPADKPVSPSDVAATIYAALGIDPATRIYDTLNRPHTLVEGDVLGEVLKGA